MPQEKMEQQISAKIIADSISPQNERLITMELVFPRIILSEFNKHRMLSSNTSSCLSGDTLITFDLPTKQNGNKFKSFKMTIKDFCEKWHNGQKKKKKTYI